MTEAARFDEAACAAFDRLTLMESVPLLSLAKRPECLATFLLAARFCLSFGAGDAVRTRAQMLTALGKFLSRYASWLAASPEELFALLRGCGVFSGSEEALTVSSVASDFSPEEFAAYLTRARQERDRARREKREALQSKNRAVNTVRPAVDEALDETLMREALMAAHQAQKAGEVPVGAVLVQDGVIVARAGNTVCSEKKATAHAEMNVINRAASKLGSTYLTGATLYVTLEPCAMCAAAISHARIARVVWAADDPERGAMGGKLNLAQAMNLNHRPAYTRGVLGEECAGLLRGFFERRRQKSSPGKK